MSVVVGEFLLRSATRYSPSDMIALEDVLFMFRITPTSQTLVARGYEAVGNARFAVEVTPAEGDGVIVQGTSKDTASAGTQISLTFKITESNYITPEGALWHDSLSS